MNRPFYINQIVPFIDKGVVKVFTGIRRCGKSRIMGMVRDVLLSRGVTDGQIVEANFESKKTDFVKTALIVDFDADRSVIKEKVLDEIRNKYPKYQFDAILDADYSD